MTVNRKKSQILVLLILIIVCAIKTNFFRNLADVLSYRFEDRIKNKYGFCSGESIGYLFYHKIKLSMINNNIFEPKNIEFFHDKFDEIESFEILNNSRNSKKINWKLEAFLVDKSGNEKIIRVINIEDLLDESLKIKLNILNENLHLDKKKINFRLENKSISEIKNLQINLIMKNKYMLENFQIIDKIDNCYYIR